MSVKGTNATTVIFSFHSTVVMNFISAYSIFSAYPQLTLDKCGLINTPYKPTSRCLVALKKYKKCGFSIKANLTAWPEFDDHVCMKVYSCSMTVQDLYDQGALFIPFSSKRSGH